MPKGLEKLSKAFHLAEDVPLEANRDHLANERTFHAWLRLSLGVSAMGVVIAQMSRIQRTVHPIREHEIKYYVLGVPQAAICQVIAIIVMAVAVFRFFKHERAIKRGKAHVGGWDLLFTGALIMLLVLTFIGLIFFIHILEVME